MGRVLRIAILAVIIVAIFLVFGMAAIVPMGIIGVAGVVGLLVEDTKGIAKIVGLATIALVIAFFTGIFAFPFLDLFSFAALGIAVALLWLT